MKKIYICGDSFGCSDPDYPGQSWSEQLVSQLPADAQVVNLCKVSASNLLISLQVDHALQNQADFVIVLATSVLRDEVRLNQESQIQQPLLERFVDITLDDNPSYKDLISYTSLNINDRFLHNKSAVLKDYASIKDLELLIYRDQCIIENTLQKLHDAGVPFLFDQGGFENPQYGNITKQYFKKFKQYFSQINLWNYTTKRLFRPYHHIVDSTIISEIAIYYSQSIIEKLAIMSAPSFGPSSYSMLQELTQVPKKLFIQDHMEGFDSEYKNKYLDSLVKQADQGTVLTTYYVMNDQVKKNYPNFEFNLDQRQTNCIFQSLKEYNQHPPLDYKNFLCSFNGSAHVSRKLLVSALDKFGWFDQNYCTKNFSLTPKILDGHLQDLVDRGAYWPKFFSFDPEFLETVHSDDYRPYDHLHNIRVLESRLTQSFIHVVSETMSTSYHPFVSEKSFYSIVTRGLFVVYAQPGWHDYFEKHFGFKKYSKLFDYTFDSIINPVERLVSLLSMLSKFSRLSANDWTDLYHLEQDTIEYNYNHYFSGNYLDCLKKYYD
jgi:hypothetical protein